MKALILYFSGTGNTKYVANLFSQALSAKGVSVQMRSIEEPQPIEPGYDFLVVGCPKYYEYPAMFLLQYLRKALPAAQQQTPTLAFCTQASAVKTDFTGLAKILQQKNHELQVTQFFTIANDLMFFGGFAPTPAQEAQTNLEKAAQAVPGLVETFLAGQRQTEKIAPFLRPVYHAVAAGCTATMPLFAMKYAASDACIGCGLCAKSCPKSNIQMVEKRPEFGKNCIFCTRCINLCPAHAILYGGKQYPQYVCRG
ncbi:MAG: hypothetical protein PWQ08_1332 [Clostridiales bacterium]|nr:hypothetical protein [Clostridiales bacterium]